MGSKVASAAGTRGRRRLLGDGLVGDGGGGGEGHVVSDHEGLVGHRKPVGSWKSSLEDFKQRSGVF